MDNLIIASLNLVYWLYNLLTIKNDKLIKLKAKQPLRYLVVVPTILIATYFILKDNSLIVLINAFGILMGAVVYALKESGLGEQGVIYKGLYYPFKKIKSLSVESVGDDVGLKLEKGRRRYFLTFDYQQSKILKDYVKTYQQIRRSQ